MIWSSMSLWAVAPLVVCTGRYGGVKRKWWPSRNCSFWRKRSTLLLTITLHCLTHLYYHAIMIPHTPHTHTLHTHTHTHHTHTHTHTHSLHTHTHAHTHTQAEVLSSLSHRNIIKFYGAVTVAPNYSIITGSYKST